MDGKNVADVNSQVFGLVTSDKACIGHGQDIDEQ
jgi:hypothetical protein